MLLLVLLSGSSHLLHPCFVFMPNFTPFLKFSLEIFSIIVSSNLISITFIWHAVMLYQHIYFCCFLNHIPHFIAKSIITSTHRLHWTVMSDSPQPMDCSPPASSAHAIFQARILEWVAIYSFRGSSRPRDQTGICLLHCRQILYQLSHLGSPSEVLRMANYMNTYL